MSTKKITFTVKSINKNDGNDEKNTNARVQDLDFPVENGNVKIVRIYFIMHDQNQKSKFNILEEQQTYELSFDDGVVSVNKNEEFASASKEGGHFASASASMSSSPKMEPKKEIFVVVNEENKEVRVIVKPEFQLNLAKQSEQSGEDNQDQKSDDQNKKSGNADKKALIAKNIQAIRAKLSAAGITAEQEIEILGNSWETDYKMSWVNSSVEEIEGFKNERTKAIEEWIAENKKDTPEQPPKKPEPTKEEVDNTKNDLKNARNSDDEKKLEEALKNARETTKNSSDEDLKREKEETERKLGEKNPQKSREVIRDEVNEVLQENEVKPEDLSPSVKQKYDELNNNNNNNNNIETSQAQAIRTEIFNDMGEKTLEKLMTALEQALKDKDSNKIESESKKLQEFANDQIDYKKQAYEKKRDEVQRLLDQAKSHSSQENSKDNGFFRFNNPLMWVSGVAVVGVIFGAAALIVRSRKRKNQ